MHTANRRAFCKASAGAAIAAAVPRARADDTLELKFGNDLPASHSVNVRLVEAIRAIKDETKGRLVINLFPNNQLGSNSDMISQLRSGALEMATMPSTVLSTLIPAASLTGVGYAFKDYNQVWAAADGELGVYIGKAIQKVGLVPFQAMWDNGFRQITSSTHPVRTPDDLKGFKIRVPVVQLWVQMFAAFGAAPTTIPLSEAYSALQTKIADGQENPLVLIEAAKFYEVQKYCSLTNHAWDGFWLLASGKRWKEVPKDLQEVMAKHFNAAAKKQRLDVESAKADTQKQLEAKGLAFNTTDPEQFRSALAKTSFYKDARAKFGDEGWTILQTYAGPIG